nr:hypothetical protein [Tanacetum cinerariifolium]
FAADLSIEERIDMINELVKYQDHYAKVLKYQSQQRMPPSKKQQREFYMSVLKSHSGWKTKHFKGMTLDEIKEKFIPVWKQIEDFMPMGSKEEGERFKRKGLRLEQDNAKKMKTSEERNKSDLNTMSLDNLYNHLKVYEPEVQKKSESNSQNMAFISLAKNISGNEEVNTASIPTASTQVSPAGPNVTTASISFDTAYAYIASQSNES